jgi:hypothetical protein
MSTDDQCGLLMRTGTMGALHSTGSLVSLGKQFLSRGCVSNGGSNDESSIAGSA